MGWQRSVLKLIFADDTDFAGLEVVMRRPSIGALLDLDVAARRDVTSDAAAGAGYLELCSIMATHLVRWNVEDETSGEPVALDCSCAAGDDRRWPAHGGDCTRTLALFSRDMEMINAIIHAWREAAVGIPDPLEKNSSDSPSSVEGSIPMETYSPPPPS